MTNASKAATSKYWDKRLNRDSAAPTLPELVATLNLKLRADPGYRPGTRFILVCDEGGGEFPTWEGPPESRSLIHRVLLAVTRDVPLPVPFQMDGVVLPDPATRPPTCAPTSPLSRAPRSSTSASSTAPTTPASRTRSAS